VIYLERQAVEATLAPAGRVGFKHTREAGSDSGTLLRLQGEAGRPLGFLLAAGHHRAAGLTLNRRQNALRIVVELGRGERVILWPDGGPPRLDSIFGTT
jgi:hypothetical protein